MQQLLARSSKLRSIAGISGRHTCKPSSASAKRRRQIMGGPRRAGKGRGQEGLDRPKKLRMHVCSHMFSTLVLILEPSWNPLKKSIRVHSVNICIRIRGLEKNYRILKHFPRPRETLRGGQKPLQKLASGDRREIAGAAPGQQSLKHSAETGRGDFREAQILETLIKNGPPEIAGAAPGQQILETLCKNGPRRSPGGPNP